MSILRLVESLNQETIQTLFLKILLPLYLLQSFPSCLLLLLSAAAAISVNRLNIIDAISTVVYLGLTPFCQFISDHLLSFLLAPSHCEEQQQQYAMFVARVCQAR